MLPITDMLGAMFGDYHMITFAPLLGDLLPGCSLSLDFPEWLLAPMTKKIGHIEYLLCILQGYVNTSVVHRMCDLDL